MGDFVYKGEITATEEEDLSKLINEVLIIGCNLLLTKGETDIDELSTVLRNEISNLEKVAPNVTIAN